MNIIFQWSSDRISLEQKQKVEEDIREEMPQVIEMFAEPPNDLVVHLSERGISLVEGHATNSSGNTLVTIRHELWQRGIREYCYRGETRRFT